jgi:hypothetical protein
VVCQSACSSVVENTTFGVRRQTGAKYRACSSSVFSSAVGQ